MADLKEKLFSEFPSISTEEWMAKITADLKGAPFEKKLVWKTGEGFNVNPFYRAEDIEGLKTITSLPDEFPYVRGTKKDNDWKVRQNVDVTDFKAANKKALDLLQKGVTSLGFHFKGEDVNAENISTLLNGIVPEAVELNFKTCNNKAEMLIGILGNYLKEKGADLSKCFGSVAYNPFKKPLVKGREADNWVEQASAVLKAGRAIPRYKVLAVDACSFSDAGAYITQELGYALAAGNEILAKLTEAGFPADEVGKKIKFNFGISANYFMEIAKFRAARWLWAEIVAAYNPRCQREECPNNKPDGMCRCSCKMAVHAQTSNWNMTIYDAHVNMLRTQTEAMSAAIAGVDSITVAPFNEAYETPDDFSERIARNQQLLLKEECHFDKVVDPSAGSYYIEVLTNSLADVAWKLFLEVEDKGGFYAAVKAGDVQNAVNASSVARKKALATRREILLGTNQYPNFTETAATKIKAEDCGCGCGCKSEATIPALDFSRGASEFEALRLATEKSGKTPKVFMFTIGNLAMRLARSQFSSNFFACAGYKVIDNLGFETVEAGVDAAVKAGAEIVVLCSSDDEYVELAPAAYKALAGKAQFVVAGAPECMDDLKAQGITEFINVKSNVLETLKAFNAKLGIA
ncbi:methylmalonyl-CoA mutase [Parabacteroides sp. PF5-5]|uniref:methylmalonyl-CoA mutase small subunit n=1 Tax=unclassified Parabacteroides TaxID=2649774 RepID=UPI0024771FAE|nr:MULTISPECIES: methylmalonyl-CoA mutase small subunit [unclassified Parabacteroides]MDH6305375.1 methylmalonyl-CoA mutase [Parabacteroides sp. PH5-39]MDH6316085.1 methylmalonyl-CoA mutase [Parabacteroides sp. PF5-13]MDH6320235.1 methylmalonyl-CoA mutase [Parabacteroides sp. PH5-13]MDH6323965.1 methylmalonyl-CoA mutase [Parabacteroides sp. PH5-8]MDH6327276.1 methylmalonyl-CoA mutase [Parabacteroides sp. PH5-41]